MSAVFREARFAGTLWRANLLAALEYRTTFFVQAAGMALNNAAFFVFWLIFFQRFRQVRGWHLHDVMLTYGLIAAGFGASVYLLGNLLRLSAVIAEGELDHYLSLPRPVLLHALAAKSAPSGLGDVTFGFAALVLSGPAGPGEVLRFAIGALLAAVIFCSAVTIAHSLSFWSGDSSMLGFAMQQGLTNFGTYPLGIYGGWTRLLIFSAVPAALVGAVPASLVHAFDWRTLGLEVLAAAIFSTLAIATFQRGLGRYQSGSAIQLRV